MYIRPFSGVERHGKDMKIMALEQAAGGATTSLFSILMIVVMLAFFYFFLYRPQKKQEKATNKMREGLEAVSYTHLDVYKRQI